ncbi:hypothetical protein ACIG54_08930 [Streptomyces achromogenes]|uniref:hypothetical protein n=1 Tax=Streptomyces achromogenes TaxID=67255 RepID=UPI0037D802D0
MSRPRVVIVGAGSTGHRAARTSLRLTRNRADITPADPAGHFPHLPLPPQAATGVPKARRVTVPLTPRARPAEPASGQRPAPADRKET